MLGRLIAYPAPGYVFQAIDDEELAVVVGPEHPLARKRQVKFDALLAFQWVLQPAGSPMRDVVDREFRDHDAVIPSGLVETGSILTTINLIRRSPLIAVIPKAVAQRDSEHGVLHIISYRLQRNLEAYGSITLRDRPLSKPAQRFLELLHSRPVAS